MTAPKHRRRSPALAERAEFDAEGPRGAWLMRDVPRLGGDVGRLDEEKSSLARFIPSRPGHD